MNAEDTAWAGTAILWAALLAFLIIGSWTAAIIVTVIANVALGAVWFWQAGRVIKDARNDVGDDTLAMLHGLPGPGRPQQSGVSRHEDTGISEWTDAELAFLHGHRETPDG